MIGQSFSSLMQGLLFLALCVLFGTTQAFGSHRYANTWDSRVEHHVTRRVTPPWPATAPTLRRRGVSSLEPPVMDLSCRWICMLATCGCGPSSNTLNKRANSPSLSSSPFRVWNHSTLAIETLDEADWKYLQKRAGGFPEKNEEWTPTKLDSFLPDAMETIYVLYQGTDPDDQIRAVRLVDGETMASVSRLRKFYRRNGLQIGTPGLHGCTVLTLISNRAVWMTHLWQAFAIDANIVAANGLPSDDETDPTFQTRVLNFISGDGNQEPTNIGPSVDWTLFNQANDNTFLLIHTPALWDWNPTMGQDSQYALYPKKMDAIKNLVKQRIPGARIVLHLYKALNYRVVLDEDGNETYEGPDAARVDNSARGYNVFQFDGYTWRLFAEYDIYVAQAAKDAAN